MIEPITIYCPKCGRKVGVYDGKSTMNINVNCNKCRKRIVYHSLYGETKIKDIPARETSSGVRFY